MADSPRKRTSRSLPLLLPAVEDGIFSDSWRIRQSSVELLGDLLFKVAGTSGKALLEGGSDDEGASIEAQGRAIIEVLGREKRNEVLAALYMVRTDVSLIVRQAALHVWKTIVANTPKTLKEIMPVLMNTLITSLASSSPERRQLLDDHLVSLLESLGKDRRQGVCIGLSEVMASAGKSQLLSFMDELIPTIRTALCDSMPEVREPAGLAFSTLYKSAGLQANDEIVPTLLNALEGDETSDTALYGLKQILNVRTAAVLPHILPKLVHPPLWAFNAHALGALAEVAGPGLDFHLSIVVPALLTAVDDDNMEVQNLAKKAVETVVLVIDEEGIEPLISELLKGVGDHQASIRRSSSYLLGYFFKNSKLYLVDEAPNVITTLIVLLSDSDSATVAIAIPGLLLSYSDPDMCPWMLVAWEALSRVVGSVPKEVLPSYIKLVRDAVSTSRDKERRKRKGGPVLIPGLCLPKALQPLLPIFLQAVLREPGFDVLLHYWSGIVLGLGIVMDEKVKRSKGYAFIQYTSQDDALLALESMDHKGRLKNGNIAAIKVLSLESSQGVKEFLTEIRVISDIEHQNLVKLYGCCVDEDHRILVYNYLENNSLAQTLIEGRGQKS
ncbi:unnamed protein product [Camellia sinensis]